MTFQFYKKDDREKHNQGTYSVYFDFPWYCIPPEYKDDFESIYKVICEVLAQNFDESYFKRYIGKNSLNEELPTWKLINNSFYANMDDYSINKVIEKICEVLKEKDKNCSVRFGEFSKKNSESNYWIGRMNVLDTDTTLKAVLTYKGKEYNIAGTSHSGGLSASSKIYIDGQLAFGASG